MHHGDCLTSRNTQLTMLRHWGRRRVRRRRGSRRSSRKTCLGRRLLGARAHTGPPQSLLCGVSDSPAEKIHFDCHAIVSFRASDLFGLSSSRNLISYINPMRPIRPISPIAPSLYNPLEKLAQLENLAHPFIIHVSTAQPSIKNNTPF